MPILIRTPRGTYVVVIKKPGAPGAGVNDVAVPLNQKQVLRAKVAAQFLEYEAGVLGARTDAGDRLHAASGQFVLIGAVAQEHHVTEPALTATQVERAQRQQGVDAIDGAQGDGGQIEHGLQNDVLPEDSMFRGAGSGFV